MQQDEEDTDLHKDWAPVPNVYALGDCCADLDRPLPALAQAGGGASGRVGMPALQLSISHSREGTGLRDGSHRSCI